MDDQFKPAGALATGDQSCPQAESATVVRLQTISIGGIKVLIGCLRAIENGSTTPATMASSQGCWPLCDYWDFKRKKLMLLVGVSTI